MTPDAAGLRAAFERRYGTVPAGIARAPGRVNLIGEHIDYCGLSVLPLALDRAVSVAFRPTGDRIVRVGSRTGAFPDREFDVTLPIPPGPAGDWGNYARAAVTAVDEAGWSRGEGGFEALVETDLPIAAGLSSSSALVVAIAMAALAAAGRDEVLASSPLELAEVLARGERYVGTAGGGMDQAASILGRAGCLLRVDFDPLRVAYVAWPDAWRLVVAHSGEAAEKSGAARATYNRRTRESRDAVRAAWRAAGEPERGERANGVLRSYPELLARPGLVEAVRREVPAELRPRFDHITRESCRVEAAERAVRARDLDALGALLLESHVSLRDDYEVSTARLDELVATATAAGAVGARLTGAGLGGCIVAACDRETVDDVGAALCERAGPASVFVARPSAGAAYLEVD